MPTPFTISCDKCNNGYPTSQMYIAPSCPPGTIPSGSGNPCNPPSQSMVSCVNCQGGNPIVNMFLGPNCPSGWTPQGSGNPCATSPPPPVDRYRCDAGACLQCTPGSPSSVCTHTEPTCNNSCASPGPQQTLYGCMDPNAINYYPAATVNQNCVYSSGPGPQQNQQLTAGGNVSAPLSLTTGSNVPPGWKANPPREWLEEEMMDDRSGPRSFDGGQVAKNWTPLVVLGLSLVIGIGITEWATKKI